MASAAGSAQRVEMTIGPAEPISPELVLVSPELRTLAIAAMWQGAEGAAFSPAARDPEPAAPAGRGLVGRLALYAFWQAFVGAIIGFAAFAAFSALVLALALIAR